MATRQVRDAKDSLSGELIYFKGHAQAVYMSDGTTVEDAINNIEISGGGSNEDNRYFTDFTVEEFIEGCVNLGTITNSVVELSNAVNNNKIICVPYNNSDFGFLIATYKKSNSSDSYFEVYLETDGAKCSAYCYEENDYGDSVGLFGISYVSFAPQTVNIEVSDNGYTYIEMRDNTTFNIVGEVNYLGLVSSSTHNSSTIRFTTGADSSLEILDNVLWTNGIVPILDPYTNYELSVARGYDGYYAVLIPFKQVE